MSAGPIAAERRGHVVEKPVEPSKADAVHGESPVAGRALCGARKVTFTDDRREFTCGDCQAAARADEAAS